MSGSIKIVPFHSVLTGRWRDAVVWCISPSSGHVERHVTDNHFLVGAGELAELRKREQEKGIAPDEGINSFMTVDAIEGKRESLVTEYILHILGLSVSCLTCAKAPSVKTLSRCSNSCLMSNI